MEHGTGRYGDRPYKDHLPLRLWRIQRRAGLCAGLMLNASSVAENEIQKLC